MLDTPTELEPMPADAPAIVTEPRAPVLTGVLLFVAAVGLYIGVGFAAHLLAPRMTADSYRWTLAIGQIVSFILPSLALARLQGVGVVEGLRLRPASPVAIGMAVLGVFCVMMIVQSYALVQELYLVPESWLASYLSQLVAIHARYVEMLGASSVAGLLGALFTMTVVPGICEELLMRGALQRSLEWRVRPVHAIILTSLLFALLHRQLPNFVPLAMIGGYFGYIAWRTRSIVPSMVAHATFNAMMVVMMQLFPKISGGERHTPAQLVQVLPGAVVSTALLIVIIRWLNNRYRTSEPIFLEQ